MRRRWGWGLLLATVGAAGSSVQPGCARECRFLLRGIPKSGTTLLERAALLLAREACNVVDGCAFEIGSGLGRSERARRRGFSAGPIVGARDGCGCIRFTLAWKHRLGGKLLPGAAHSGHELGQAALAECAAAVPPVAVTSMDCFRRVEQRLQLRPEPGLPHATSGGGAATAGGGGLDPAVGPGVVPRVVHISRDPRAVAVSACRFFNPERTLRQCPMVTSLFESRVAAAAIESTYWSRVLEPGSAMTVRFEQLRNSPRVALAALGDFMGLAQFLDDAALHRVARGITLEAMQALEAQHAVPSLERNFSAGRMPGVPPPLKVRSGEVGGFAAELDPATLQRMNETMSRHGWLLL